MIKNKNIIKIVSVIIGTLIGAGFASGKEIYNFFARYGIIGMIGIIVSTIFMGLIKYSTLKIIRKMDINNNEEFIESIKGKKVLYAFVNVFLLASFYIMIAGFSAYFKQEFNISTYISSTIICILIYLILIQKTNGILKLNTILIPILIVIMIYISIKYANIGNANIKISGNICHSLIDGILYASYNSIILIPILITVKKYINTDKDIIAISSISSIIMMILAFGIYIMLLNSKLNIDLIELPIVNIVNNKLEKYMYSIVIEAAIFTSAISAGYGILENLKEETKKDNKKYKAIIIIMCIFAIPISGIGFGNLVNTLYPLFGVLGLFQIILILRKSIEKK